MNAPELDRVYEAALHALVTQRCQRAYAHDMRNGLQGISGGFELLSRALKTEGGKIPSERTIDFSKQAIKNHGQTLDLILGQLVLREETPSQTRLGEVLREVNRFLNNDAGSRDIALRVTVTDDASIEVRPGRLRLVLIGLIVEAIDSLPPQSELRVQLSKHGRNARIEILSPGMSTDELSDTSKPSEEIPIDLRAEPLRKGLIVPVSKNLIEAEGGSFYRNLSQTLLQFSDATSES